MSRPRRFWRVEWDAARTFETPHDRKRVERNFTSAAAAARQVRAVRSWPSHLELIAVSVAPPYDTDDLTWVDVSVSDLPDVPDDVEHYYGRLEKGRQEHPDPAVQRAYYAAEAAESEEM